MLLHRYSCLLYGWDIIFNCLKLSFLLGWLAALKLKLRHLEQEIYKCIFLIVRNVTTLHNGSEK